MPSYINFFIFILWLYSALADYSVFTYIWQLKEYRIDRFRDFLTTQEGYRFWNRYSIFWRGFIAAVAIFWPLNNVLFLKYLLLIFLFFDFFVNSVLILKKKLRHPVFTPKAILIIGISLLVEGGLFVLTKDWALLFLLMFFRFIVNTIIVQAFALPTSLAKKLYIFRAKQKIKKYKDLLIIGVTGSYGKTTVKSFLGQILAKKYSVITTPKNINTEIGVAKFILGNNFEDKEVFVVEMGAYTVGEIGLIAKMINPKIGILTAINEQHLSLFGSIQNTQKAKFELLHALPKKNGLAVVNFDNFYIREKLDTLKVETVTYGSDEDLNPDCLVEDIKSKNGILTTVISYKDLKYNIEAKILGNHNANNIAACVAVGEHLKMNKEEIENAVNDLEPPEQTLKMYKYKKAIIIDDSYNANPDGFLSALDTFSTFSSNFSRVVVTRGIPELGDKTKEIHEKIGGAIDYSAEELVIIKKDYSDYLKKGINEKYNTRVKDIYDPKELLLYMNKLAEKETVILLENRIPASVHNILTKESV